MKQKRPAVFFDRDNTLIYDAGYTYRPESLKWMPGALEAILLCNKKNYFVFVVTNQSGVARGFYNEEDVDRFHSHMQQQLEEIGAHIDAFEFCPHLKDCSCRKPKTGMLENLVAEWPVDIEKSLLIGNDEVDIQAAHNFGIPGIKYEGGTVIELLKEVL